MGKLCSSSFTYIVEEDLNLKEPVNFKRYLIIIWMISGYWLCKRDFKKFYERMSEAREGVDY